MNESIELIVTVKPSKFRDMVQHSLEKAGFKITGSGYMIPTDTGDLTAEIPSGASPDEFGPVVTPCNLPTSDLDSNGIPGPPFPSAG